MLQPQSGCAVFAAVLLVAEDQVQPARQVPPHGAPVTYATQLQVLLLFIQQYHLGRLQVRQPCAELSRQLVCGRYRAAHGQRGEPNIQLFE
jgi:hypothetical protein